MTANYQLYLLDDVDILTNCLKALAEFRRDVGEYWPATIVIHRRNRLSLDFGEGIKVSRMSDKEGSWIIINALYMSLDDPLRDSATIRKATVMPIKTRQPIFDVYQTQYRMRDGHAYVLDVRKRS